MNLYDFFRRHKNGGNGSTVQNIPSLSKARRQGGLDLGSVRMLEEKLASKQNGTWLSGTRTAQEEFSCALIETAKECGLYISKDDCRNLGVRKMLPSGESIILENKAQGIVYKIRDPFAKLHLKSPNLNNILYEHIIHNIMFPEVPYSLVGISEDNGSVRIVLSQSFVFEMHTPTQQQIDEYLFSFGLQLEDRYYYGNKHIAITDVDSTGDNVLLSSAGVLLFIDPIIKIKTNGKEAIEFLLKSDY